jgi:hypothetical protein
MIILQVRGAIFHISSRIMDWIAKTCHYIELMDMSCVLEPHWTPN